MGQAAAVQKKMRGCDAWEHSRKPAPQKPGSPPGMPVQRGTPQKAWDDLSIQLGSGRVLAREQFPHLGKDTAQLGKAQRGAKRVIGGGENLPLRKG